MTPNYVQLQIFIEADITVGKKQIKTCQERPYLFSGRFVSFFYNATTW